MMIIYNVHEKIEYCSEGYESNIFLLIILFLKFYILECTFLI